MDGDWLLRAQAIVLALTALRLVLDIRDFRNRPGAPPPSTMVRWSVFGSIFATVSLIAFMFWLAARQPH